MRIFEEHADNFRRGSCQNSDYAQSQPGSRQEYLLAQDFVRLAGAQIRALEEHQAINMS